LTKHILPKWGTTPLVAVSHRDVQAWVTKLSETLAPSSVRKIHVVFSGLMKYAAHDRRIPRDPCDGIRLPRVGASSRGYLTPQQVDELAASCGPDSDIIYLLAYTGPLWGEMAALKVKRVDLERRRLDVAEAVAELEGEIIWGTPKNHERRSVPFPEFLKDAMTIRTEGKQPTSSRSPRRSATSSATAISAAAVSTRLSRPSKRSIRSCPRSRRARSRTLPRRWRSQPAPRSSLCSGFLVT
ncbi:MAG: hypothetical protein QOF79_2986, partial [Actinomycetota bacterium]|nr:hypothetical protein [Actinomycetota bacterium]